MKGTSAKRSSLFLLELIIAILFFSLTSAVCVQIFVRAHLISRQTQELNTALEKVSGFSEVFLAGDSFSALLPEDASVSENADGSAEYLVFYDKNWQLCSSSDATYEIQIRIDPQGLCCTVRLPHVLLRMRMMPLSFIPWKRIIVRNRRNKEVTDQ